MCRSGHESIHHQIPPRNNSRTTFRPHFALLSPRFLTASHSRNLKLRPHTRIGQLFIAAVPTTSLRKTGEHGRELLRFYRGGIAVKHACCVCAEKETAPFGIHDLRVQQTHTLIFTAKAAAGLLVVVVVGVVAYPADTVSVGRHSVFGHYCYSRCRCG